MVLPSFKETAPYMADFGGSDGTAPVVGKGLKQNCEEHTCLIRIAKVHNVVFPPAPLKQNHKEHTRLMRITKVQKVGSPLERS